VVFEVRSCRKGRHLAGSGCAVCGGIEGDAA
jgi:hypothetical protein